MNVLEVSNLTKKFGNFTAVNSISFALKQGEILGFLGPNGAGKTTTIQMLLGALTPTTGAISYFNKSLFSHREEILDRLNFSTTYTNMPWHLTVRECLHYTTYLYSIPNRKKRMDEIIQIFKLELLANKSINSLSAGQRTRVNLAKAFLNHPDILLLDEPTASLDPDIAKYIRDLITNQREQSNVSILFTSHNMHEVEEICDRVVFINNGEIIADDTPQQLAKSIEISHVELLISKGVNVLREYCDKTKLEYRTKGKFIVIDIHEQQIPKFLKDIMDHGVLYDEISIEKPDLEDYFLKHSKNL
jgi:ABC-2 type transport system ATP-binding protein